MPDYHRMLQTLEDGTFAPARFNHEDHVALGFQAILTHGPAKGARVFAEGLQSAAERLGLTEKYHETITMAFLSIIAERMDRSRTRDAASFVEDNADLLTGEVLARYYSPDRLASPLARSAFLLPDRAG